MNYKQLEFRGAASANDFENALNANRFGSIHEGFQRKVARGEKVISDTDPPQRSIISVRVNTTQVTIVRDQFDESKLKLHVLDNDGSYYRYLAITDLGFHTFATARASAGRLEELQEFIRTQDYVYLRIGLSRVHEASGRRGFWLQANGIYTFPDFRHDIRRYEN